MSSNKLKKYQRLLNSQLWPADFELNLIKKIYELEKKEHEKTKEIRSQTERKTDSSTVKTS